MCPALDLSFYTFFCKAGIPNPDQITPTRINMKGGGGNPIIPAHLAGHMFFFRFVVQLFDRTENHGMRCEAEPVSLSSVNSPYYRRGIEISTLNSRCFRSGVSCYTCSALWQHPQNTDRAILCAVSIPRRKYSMMNPTAIRIFHVIRNASSEI